MSSNSQQQQAECQTWKIEGGNKTELNVSLNSIGASTTSNLDNSSCSIRYEHEELFFNNFIGKNRSDASIDIESQSQRSSSAEQRLSRRFSLDNKSRTSLKDDNSAKTDDITVNINNLSAIEQKLFGPSTSASTSLPRRQSGFQSKNQDDDIEMEIKNMLKPPRESSKSKNPIKKFISLLHQPVVRQTTSTNVEDGVTTNTKKSRKQKKTKGPSIQFYTQESFPYDGCMTSNEVGDSLRSMDIDDSNHDDITVKVDNKRAKKTPEIPKDNNKNLYVRIMFVLLISLIITSGILLALRLMNRTKYEKSIGMELVSSYENSIEDIVSAYVDVEERLSERESPVTAEDTTAAYDQFEHQFENEVISDNGASLELEDIASAYANQEQFESDNVASEDKSEYVDSNLEQDFPSNPVTAEDPLIELPSELANIADLSDKFLPENGDIPFFFHVPLTAGVMVQSVLSICHNLVQASNFFTYKDNNSGWLYDEPLQVISSSSTSLRSSNDDDVKYVNVNTDSKEDIERAKRLKLAESNLADVIISPQLLLSSSIFTSEHKGRMFTLLRHPIERAHHMYYVKRNRSDEVASMSIQEYSTSKHMENNWLTRFLSGKQIGALTDHDLNVAKEVLKRKCLIGLVDNVDESINRFVEYFNFKSSKDNTQQCHENVINDALQNNNFGGDEITEDSDDWNALLNRNIYDMQVYNYAVQLFEEQGISVQGGVI